MYHRPESVGEILLVISSVQLSLFLLTHNSVPSLFKMIFEPVPFV